MKLGCDGPLLDTCSRTRTVDNFPFKKSSAGLSAIPDETHSDNDFSEAINLFKTQREKYGFSLEKLSTETKISHFWSADLWTRPPRPWLLTASTLKVSFSLCLVL